MIKYKLYYIIACLSIFTFFNAQAMAVNGDMGLSTQPLTDGSVDYPYLIEDISDFRVFSGYYNAQMYRSQGVYIRMMVDLDCDGQNIGMVETFLGEFDANNHTMRSCLFPLFKELAGTVKNLIIEDVLITRSYSGVLTDENYGNIINCHVSGYINDVEEYYVGGYWCRIIKVVL